MIDELNVIIKDLRNIDIKFGLIYPNIYSIGMSSYSIRFLYSYLNSFENIACERIFLPPKIKYPASMDYNSIDVLRSLENKLLPEDFDILGFSIQFENDFRNILWILEKGRIPLLNNKRENKEKKIDPPYPLIIGGGPVATSNPIPLSNIFDAFFIGDAEPNLMNLLELFMNYKYNNQNKQNFLQELKNIKGIYIPSLNNRTKRAILKNLDQSQMPIYQIMARSDLEGGSFEDTYFIEVNRGCPYKCKFCISSFHNRPFRNRSFQNIKETIDVASENLEFERISLIGSCISGHPQFYDICKYILKKNKRLSIPSIRIDHVSPKIIDILEKGDIKTISIAPESGSESLRYELGKKISNEKLFDILVQIKESKINNVKMYFIIGLPNEKDEDIEKLIRLVKKMDSLGFDKNSLKININPLIPKLNTPYEKEVDYYIENKIKILKKRFEKIENELSNLISINLKTQKIDSLIKNARLQTVFSLGNKDISDLLINYYNKGANFGALRRAENNSKIKIDDYLLEIKNCYNPWKYDL